MTAHQFRHLAGKFLLDDSPGAYEAVAQLLGHTSTKNVVKFYGGPDPRRATRHQAVLIEKLRQEAQLHGSRRRKR
jgi:integrase